MSYNDETIAATVGRVNHSYFLPAIQREFVWNTDQTIRLFDSIMREYPISSFLFWRLQPTSKGKWDVYKFVQNYKQGVTHNESVSTNSIHELILVLDGQQRLTSLLIGLMGSYTVKRKYKRKNSPDAWNTQRLYLNLFKSPDAAPEDSDEGLRYEFQFHDTPLPPDDCQYWFEIGKILNYTNEHAFDVFVETLVDGLADSIPKDTKRVCRLNLRRLYSAVHKDRVIAYYTEENQDFDRVLDIFVRANDGGTKLSKSDLLLSMVTAHWGKVKARDEIFAFVDRLNGELTKRNGFDKDLILKACLVLCDLPVQYRLSSFDSANLAKIQDSWGELKSAMERAVNLVNQFGIDCETLTSANALIPIMYYFYTHPKTSLQGSSTFDAKNARAIRIWLTACLLNNVFGGQSDTLLTELRAVMKAEVSSPDFPAEALRAKIAKLGRSATFDTQAIENVLEIKYGLRTTFLALSLLYDTNEWGRTSYHQDHIFPQDLFKKINQSTIPTEQRSRYVEKMNCLANLELLLGFENESKSATLFDAWLLSRDTEFKKKHLIPPGESLYKFEHFLDFIEAREGLIRQRLTNLLVAATAPEESKA